MEIGLREDLKNDTDNIEIGDVMSTFCFDVFMMTFYLIVNLHLIVWCETIASKRLEPIQLQSGK
jgi:hypothetical protein